MKKLLLLLVVFPFCVCAQDSRVPFTEKRSAVSFNPFMLIGVDFTVMAGYEHKLASKLYMSNEAGYIFASEYISNGESTSNGKGFNIRPSLKWFVAKDNKFYLQPQVFYKQVTHKMYDWVGKNPVNGVPAYEQLEEFRYRRKITGFNIVAGSVLPLDWKGNGYIDVYIGLGVRSKKSQVVEHNVVYQRPTGIFVPADDGVFASMPLGVRFIYALN